MDNQSNQLMGWLGSSGVNPSQMFGAPLPGAPNFQGPPSVGQQGPRGTIGWGNPMGFHNPGGAYETQRNQVAGVTENEQLRNQMIPAFGNQMFSLAGPAAQYYQQLMNLGSPYYQQQQRASWEQGVGQAQNQAAQARQQLEAQGLGYTPSGAEAAMMGGMGQQSAGNMAMQFLQNLFNNEQMQLQGAGGMAGLASMFNPTGMFGGTPGNVSVPPSFMQNMTSLLSSILGTGGVGGSSGIKGIAAGGG